MPTSNTINDGYRIIEGSENHCVELVDRENTMKEVGC